MKPNSPNNDSYLVSVTLESITFEGDNIGNDWNIDLDLCGNQSSYTPDVNENNITFSPKDTVFQASLVPTSAGYFRLPVTASLVEKDPKYDDQGGFQEEILLNLKKGSGTVCLQATVEAVKVDRGIATPVFEFSWTVEEQNQSFVDDDGRLEEGFIALPAEQMLLIGGFQGVFGVGNTGQKEGPQHKKWRQNYAKELAKRLKDSGAVKGNEVEEMKGDLIGLAFSPTPASLAILYLKWGVKLWKAYRISIEVRDKYKKIEPDYEK